MRTHKHLTGSIALAAAVAALIPGTALAGPAGVVLGNGKALPNSRGWGTAAPRVISSGADPGARITQIHWWHWGRATATGWGMTAIPKRDGGYYPGLYRIRLQATGIAWDPGEHARAYMQLEAKEPLAPGGRLSPWFQWVGQQQMCN